MKYLCTVAAAASILAGMSSVGARADALGDCYNDAIAACGFLWPGQDYGDDGYASCVDSGLDLCDDAHKSVAKPGFKLMTPVPPKQLQLKLR